MNSCGYFWKLESQKLELLQFWCCGIVVRISFFFLCVFRFVFCGSSCVFFVLGRTAIFSIVGRFCIGSFSVLAIIQSTFVRYCLLWRGQKVGIRGFLRLVWSLFYFSFGFQIVGCQDRLFTVVVFVVGFCDEIVMGRLQ